MKYKGTAILEIGVLIVTISVGKLMKATYLHIISINHLINLTVHCGPTGNITEPLTLDSLEDAASHIHLIDLLRGRDGRDGLPGLPGRDGEDGKPGEQGEQGPPGP